MNLNGQTLTATSQLKKHNEDVVIGPMDVVHVISGQQGKITRKQVLRWCSHGPRSQLQLLRPTTRIYGYRPPIKMFELSPS